MASSSGSGSDDSTKKRTQASALGKATTRAAVLHDNTRSPRDDRRVRGQALREAIPHELHAGWKPQSKRRSVLDVLTQSDKGRLANLVPLKYGRMMHSPFTFFRGSAALMAEDLNAVTSTGIRVQVCGDCHLLNFGAFATPERKIVFDINDFDETLPAPWEWDLKRLATSFVLLCRDNECKPKFALDAATACARAYREKITEFSRMSILDIWYAQFDWQSIIESTSDTELQRLNERELKKTQKRTIREYYFPKLTEEKNGNRVIKDNPPLISHPHIANRKQAEKQAQEAMDLYRQSLQEDRRRLLDRYELADLALKVVGIGSVGTVCAVALLLAPDDEPLFLQIKEARPSVLEPFAGASTFANHGQRVVEGQRIIQSASDIFLGWTKFADGRHFYVRQLRDMKIKLNPEIWDGKHIVEIAQVMGHALARAHARTGDAAQISGYLGTESTFDAAVADFAIAYADQTERDHTELVAAIKSGRIKAESEDMDDD